MRDAQDCLWPQQAVRPGHGRKEGRLADEDQAGQHLHTRRPPLCAVPALPKASRRIVHDHCMATCTHPIHAVMMMAPTAGEHSNVTSCQGFRHLPRHRVWGQSAGETLHPCPIFTRHLRWLVMHYVTGSGARYRRFSMLHTTHLPHYINLHTTSQGRLLFAAEAIGAFWQPVVCAMTFDMIDCLLTALEKHVTTATNGARVSALSAKTSAAASYT